MKSSKKIIIVFSLISLLGVGVYSINRLEMTHAKYNSYSEVVSISNIFDAGWIPRWLPKSARNIMESHDIDTNESWLIFEFSSSDKFYSDCSTIEKNSVYIHREEAVRHFPSFVSDIVSQLNKNDALYFFSCDGEEGRFLAVDTENYISYVWTRPR